MDDAREEAKRFLRDLDDSLVDGRYSLVETLDVGGLGLVYAARDRRLGRDVALKFLRPSLAEDSEYRTAFQEEAKLASIVLPSPEHCHDVGPKE